MIRYLPALAILTTMLALFLSFPSCHSDGDAWCFWDAQAQGNGMGTSYIALWDGVLVHVH